MQIQLLVPAQNQKRFLLDVEKTTTVAQLRKKVVKAIEVPENGFILIAFGKIMIDTSADKTEATLFSTYRIRDKTCVFVHVAKRNKNKVNSVSTQVAQHSKTSNVITPPRRIISSNSVVSTPFEDAQCSNCLNNNKIKRCEECGCFKCHLKTGDPLICDQCDNYWHIHCAGLTTIPTDQYWFCPDCINEDSKLIVGKGEAVKESSKQKTHIVIRDMDCVLVPVYHVGKIPGIYCGQTWEFRSVLYDWGMHRATTAAVAGTSLTGAVSIVLSKGLKEDRDVGYEFVFSGTGGELRTRKYSDYFNLVKDQTLTKYNKALAITCNAPFNQEIGAISDNWRKSRPIRVCRSFNRRFTHPTYAPTEGIRYDGLYKIVKYWPQKDKTNGFIVWKFLLRRDDQEAPPWMSYAKRVITKRGLRLIRSDGETTKKLIKYIIPARIHLLMKADTKNKRMWDEINKMEFWSEYEFLHYLFDTAVVCSSFVCSKPIKDPVTTPCGHICCITCLTQSNSDSCFTCRTKLSKSSIQVNYKLKKILELLNWAYSLEDNISKAGASLPSNFDHFEKDIVKHEEIVQEKLKPIETEEYPDFVIKREVEYPTISDIIEKEIPVKKASKKVSIFIEYLGEKNKKRKLDN